MAAAIMVLGPTLWREARGHAVVRQSPLDARRALAQLIREQGTDAVIMEERNPATGEDNFAFFRRLIDEASVRTFVLFWPLGARLHGLDVEIGYLLSQMEEGRLDARDVYLLAEKRLLGVRSGEAILAWSEPGNRTRYHEDLVARGCRIRRWSSEDALRAHVSAIVLEHQKRYR